MMTAETRDMNLAVSPSSGSANSGPADEVLVRRLRDGDASAGETLARRYQQPLLRYLQRIAGGDQVAEEIYQSSWLSVLENLDRFDPASVGGGFKAWLFRIATNKTNDLWRSRGREKHAKDGLVLITETTAPDAGHRIEGDEQQTKLLRAIERLPESQRQVLMLRYYSDMKFVDIASMLGCPLNTALGRMHKAVMRLKELMEE